MCHQVLNQSVAVSMYEAKAASTAEVSQSLQTNWEVYRVQNATHFSDISSMVSSFI